MPVYVLKDWTNWTDGPSCDLCAPSIPRPVGEAPGLAGPWSGDSPICSTKSWKFLFLLSGRMHSPHSGCLLLLSDGRKVAIIMAMNRGGLWGINLNPDYTALCGSLGLVKWLLCVLPRLYRETIQTSGQSVSYSWKCKTLKKQGRRKERKCQLGSEKIRCLLFYFWR